MISTYGGRTNFPVIYEDTVIANAVVVGWGDTPKWDLLARPAHRFMGFDKATGELRWLRGTSIAPPDTTYSTPVVTRLAGTPALVFGSADGQAWALQAGGGLPIWHFPFSRRGINVAPVVTPAGHVFIAHGEENTVGLTMGAVVALDGTMEGDLTGKELWQQFEVLVGKSSPLRIGDRLYVTTDSAKMMIYDVATGKFVSLIKLGTSMRSTPLYADGKIYTCTNEGRWYILEPNEGGARIVHRLRLNGEESDGSPIVSHGRIYLPTSEFMYCIGKADTTPSLAAEPVLSLPPQSQIPADGAVAQVQVVPWDAILRPGQDQPYRAAAKQTGRVPPRGQSRRGRVSRGRAGADHLRGALHRCGRCASSMRLVVCRVGGVEGKARLRIIPPLPWKFDFDEDQDVPLTWVGGRVRYVLRDVDGQRVMVKQTRLPTRPGADDEARHAQPDADGARQPGQLHRPGRCPAADRRG